MDNHILLVTISPAPRVKLISWPTSHVSVDDESFQEAAAGDTYGFYDFLRLPSGHIVGVRFTPFVEFSHICDSASPGPGLRITGAYPTSSIELFWEGERGYDSALSADQFFDCNYIFKSS